MASESAEPPPEEPPPRQAREARTERFGPLELRRTSKADGRALLLFSRRADAYGDERR